MKRKGSKKAQVPEDDSNGVEDQSEENGGASEEVDETAEESEAEEEPQKKRKSSKSNKKNVSFSKKGEDNDDEDFDEEPQEKKKKASKASKKNIQKKVKESKSEDDAENDEEDDEAQYEVEKVLDEKLIRGVRHYLIRWKGYEEESDTWEPEDTLSCQDLIKAFKEAAKKKSPKSSKGRKPVTKSVGPGEEWDENEDFEVDKILEVHFKKGGKREFLVLWKGYGLKDSSWEPEENMNCKDIIEKFMAKVERAKNIEEKELRVNRKHVQRLTYNTPDSNRRLSKRNNNRERVQYHDAE